MIKVGLTGGIGSGKTTVANYFGELGAPIIDADVLARELTEPGKAGFVAIVERYGDEILEVSGEFDRKKMRELIFADPDQKRWLESLLHPLIKKAINEKIATLDFPYCIIVIPLLVETKSYDLVDRILTVESSPELQVKRTKTRDNTSEDEVRRIIHTQASEAQRLEVADDVIYNNSDLEELKMQVNKLHLQYS